MSHSTTRWLKGGLLALPLFLLLALLSLSCTAPQVTEPTVAAIATQAQSAIETAQASGETSSTAIVKSESAAAAAQTSEAYASTAIAQSESALMVARTAEAAAAITPPVIQVTPSNPPESSTVMSIGAAISYQTADEFERILYHSVDQVEIYQTFADFEGEWLDNRRLNEPGHVQLALIETGDSSGQG